MSRIHNRGMGIAVSTMVTIQGNMNGHVNYSYITGSQEWPWLLWLHYRVMGMATSTVVTLQGCGDSHGYYGYITGYWEWLCHVWLHYRVKGNGHVNYGYITG